MAEQPTHASELAKALVHESEAQRLLLAGEAEAAAVRFRKAADHYKRSWQLAAPTSYGRLIGMTKAAILAGGGEEEGRYALKELEAVEELTPTAAYALSIASLAAGLDPEAARYLAVVERGGPQFERAARAIAAICNRDQPAFEGALKAIVADFEARSTHLTGVPIADTALMFQRLGARRGLSVALSGPVVGAAG